MNNCYDMLMSRTQKIVKPSGVTQVNHFFYVFRNYVDAKGDKTDRYPSTISRWMSGKVLPPWALVTHYAGHGTRCPEALVADLHEYIAVFYSTQSLRDALRAAIMEVLSILPTEDQEDICDYWDDRNLAHMWAVLLWYAMTYDYAAMTWSA